jgi:hypothetical protein
MNYCWNTSPKTIIAKLARTFSLICHPFNLYQPNTTIILLNERRATTSSTLSIPPSPISLLHSGAMIPAPLAREARRAPVDLGRRFHAQSNWIGDGGMNEVHREPLPRLLRAFPALEWLDLSACASLDDVCLATTMAGAARGPRHSEGRPHTG